MVLNYIFKHHMSLETWALSIEIYSALKIYKSKIIGKCICPLNSLVSDDWSIRIWCELCEQQKGKNIMDKTKETFCKWWREKFEY